MTGESSERTRSSPTAFATMLALLASALLASLLVLPLVVAPRSGAYINWTNHNAVGRANPDGSGVTQNFIRVGAGAAAVRLWLALLLGLAALSGRPPRESLRVLELVEARQSVAEPSGPRRSRSRTSANDHTNGTGTSMKLVS